MLLTIALIPLSLVQRYRMGSARRVARGWVTTLNLVALAFSSALLLVSAGFTGLWVPDALKFTAIGLLGGALAGMLGTWLTRWEGTSQGLYYTPPRILVLLVTTIVAGRILFGLWRAWRAWDAGLGQPAWFVGSEVAGTMAAGAVVVGYYLAFWVGVRRQLTRHRRH